LFDSFKTVDLYNKYGNSLSCKYYLMSKSSTIKHVEGYNRTRSTKLLCFWNTSSIVFDKKSCERKRHFEKVIHKMALAPSVISGPSTSPSVPNKSTIKNVLIPDDYEPVPVSYIDVAEGRRVAYRKFEGHLQPTILYIPGPYSFATFFVKMFRYNWSPKLFLFVAPKQTCVSKW